MDAKKAAIRSENIDRGIFIPASDFPRGEPKKAILGNGWEVSALFKYGAKTLF